MNLESISISESNARKAAAARAVIVTPTRWNHLLRDYAHGAHGARSVECLFTLVIAELHCGLRDRSARARAGNTSKPCPRLSMAAEKYTRERTIIIMLGNRTKRLSVILGDRHVEIENKVIDVSSFGGVMNLVAALTQEISKFWAGIK